MKHMKATVVVFNRPGAPPDPNKIKALPADNIWWHHNLNCKKTFGAAVRQHGRNMQLNRPLAKHR